jgi:predicted phosphodiesterase
LYHGAPWDNNQYLYPDSTAQLLNQCNDPDANFVLIGHSHYSFGCKTRDSILLNAGSVGQSRKNGGIAIGY